MRFHKTFKNSPSFILFLDFGRIVYYFCFVSVHCAFFFFFEQHDDDDDDGACGVCVYVVSDDDRKIKDYHESIVDGTPYTHTHTK